MKKARQEEELWYTCVKFGLRSVVGSLFFLSEIDTLDDDPFSSVVCHTTINDFQLEFGSLSLGCCSLGGQAASAAARERKRDAYEHVRDLIWVGFPS